METIRLQTLYVLFFIELGSRQVHLAGITSNPNEIWITQQARQLVWEFDNLETPLRFLIHDNDSKFSATFDTIFESETFHVIHTPYHSPNAYAERWERSVREECLDLILIINTAHLRRVLLAYIDDYYNVARPHQGIEQRTPVTRGEQLHTGLVRSRKVLGGIIHDYYRTSGNPAMIHS